MPFNLFGKSSHDDEKKQKFNTKKVNGMIENKMKSDQTKAMRTVRILLLGPGDSGKTTIVKQMKKIHGILPQEEQNLMKQYIKEAVVGYMKLVCTQSETLAMKGKNTKVAPELVEERNFFVNLETPCNLTHDIAERIKRLWQDQGIRRTLDFRNEYQIHDNVDYFFNRIDDISKDNYSPNFEDFVRIRVRSTGFSQETFEAKVDKFGDHTFQFVDVGGQRSERKKWMKVMTDEVDAVLFVVAISEYDMMCFEDDSTLRIVEALELFTELLKGDFFNNKSLLLFFNKYDLFKEKIKKIPITVAFPDFPAQKDPNSEEAAIKYIAEKFLASFTGSNVHLASPLHIHRTSALDTSNIKKLFQSIQKDLVKIGLAKAGYLY